MIFFSNSSISWWFFELKLRTAKAPGRRWLTLLPFQIILDLRIFHQVPGNVSWQLMAAGLLGMDHWMPRVLLWLLVWILSIYI